jgi:hypothetical protein
MPASETYPTQLRIQLRFRQAALFAAAAGPLLLASIAFSQLSTRPIPAAQNAPSTRPAPALPPAQPTQVQPAASLQPATTPAPHAYRARVEFSGNQLSITADNSSLNEILSEISRLTGMKITGGVTDERVYGSYGPDSAQVVLNQLLDGTGTNVMLLETPQHNLAELVLTPRNGGPTPPSPSASRDEERDEESLPPGLAGRRREFPTGGRRDRFDGTPGQENRQFEQPQPGQQPPAPPANPETPSTQPDASQQSPNGVKTPQQIYEELVRQQAQQQQTPTTPPQ